MIELQNIVKDFSAKGGDVHAVKDAVSYTHLDVYKRQECERVD